MIRLSSQNQFLSSSTMVFLHNLHETMNEVLQTIQSTPLHSFLLLMSFLLLLYKLITRSSAPKLNLPPSPLKLPIIGHIHKLGSLPHRSLRALAEKYGPLMLLQLGSNPTVIVSSAEGAEHLFKTHDVVSSNRRRTTAADIMLYGCQDVAFAPYGEFWRQAKKICVVELLSIKRVRSFHFVMEEEVAGLIDRIRTSSIVGGSVNLTEMLLAVSCNVISHCVLSRKAEEEGGRSLDVKLVRKFMVQFKEFSFGDMFESLWWMDYVTGLIPRLKSTGKALDAIFDQVIEEHKNSGSADDQYGKKDFVDILLQVQKSGNLGIPLSQDNIKGILMDMFLAGTETSSTIVEWLMAELLRNPDMMKKAQEEVRTIIGKKSKVEMDDVDKMSYMKCVIKETMRLHHPVAILLPRMTSTSVEWGPYQIPAKTTILVNSFAIQTDPKIWDKPDEFLPERFENNKIDFQEQDFRFLPFGGGRRGCPGASFGVTAVSHLVANLLYWFDWKLADDVAPQDLDMSEVFGVTITKKVPLHVVPTFMYSSS